MRDNHDIPMDQTRLIVDGYYNWCIEDLYGKNNIELRKLPIKIIHFVLRLKGC